MFILFLEGLSEVALWVCLAACADLIFSSTFRSQLALSAVEAEAHGFRHQLLHLCCLLPPHQQVCFLPATANFAVLLWRSASIWTVHFHRKFRPHLVTTTVLAPIPDQPLAYLLSQGLTESTHLNGFTRSTGGIGRFNETIVHPTPSNDPLQHRPTLKETPQ